jgi:hypothetical protein
MHGRDLPDPVRLDVLVLVDRLAPFGAMDAFDALADEREIDAARRGRDAVGRPANRSATSAQRFASR